MKKQLVFWMAALMLSTVACEKDQSQTTSPPKSDTEILTTGEWKLRKVESKAFLNDSLVHTDVEVIGADVRFYSDNYVVAQAPGEVADTAVWVLDGEKFWLDDIANDIITLDNEEFTFAFSEKEQYPQGEVEMRHTTYLTRKK